jgi:hypothetical protein
MAKNGIKKAKRLYRKLKKVAKKTAKEYEKFKKSEEGRALARFFFGVGAKKRKGKGKKKPFKFEEPKIPGF